MKKLFYVVMILILLCSCAKSNVQEPESFTTLPDEEYLIGLNPEELGLNFSAPDDITPLLSPTDEKAKANGTELEYTTSFLFNTVPKSRIYPTSSMSYLGCMQAVFVRMKRMGLATEKLDGVYVLNFQIYSTDEFKDGKFAKIYNMNVPYSELEKRVLYSEADFVVVDVTEFMLGKSLNKPVTLEEHINSRWKDGHPDAKYAYEIRDYVVKNIKECLTNK